jgi:hypothetical protein
MHKILNRVAVVTSGALLVAGCSGKDVLNVPNVNNPDVDRVYATAASIEGVAGGLMQQLNSAIRGSSEGLHTQSANLSLMTYGSVANFGMNTRAGIPRSAILNDRGNSVQAGNTRDFSNLSKLTRTAATMVQALDKLVKAGNTLGSPAQNARARAFSYFVGGVALGYLGMGYDSAAIVTPQVPAEIVPGLSGYKDVNAAAIRMLDSAVAIATSADATNGANGFPLPNTWINALALTQDQFVRLVKSYRARIRAGNARTPAERAAISWSAVIADATTGITADHVITLNTSWVCAYDCNQLVVSKGWGQISPMYWGMADTSGAYGRWLAQPLAQKDGNFVIITPDKRWPQGATRTAQNADSPLPLKAGQYIRNNPAGEDVSGDPFGTSQYHFARWWFLRNASGVGPYVDMPKAEMDMLAAEGYIRTGNLASATTLINASRSKNGIPTFTTPASATAAITGAFSATGCVPQVPSGSSTTCGSILEAMKYEYRMETAHTGYMPWFVAMRGWGDLVEGTALQWPVPNGEMDARVQPFYNLGGIGGASAAAKGTYGF